VATLASDVFAPGVHSVRWDGRDGTGRAVASGTYVVRLRGEEEADTRTITLVR
jgi:flagellar hook assembly protein FlgD